MLQVEIPTATQYTHWQHTYEGTNEPMELLSCWHIIRKRLWLVLLLPLLSAGSTLLYIYEQVPHYQTTVTLFVNPAQVSPSVPGVSEGFTVSDIQNAQALIQTYGVLIHTRSFVQQVAQEMHMPIPENEVQQALSSTYAVNTQFFYISATHTNPEAAREMANTAAQILVAREEQRQQSQHAQIEHQLQQAPATEQQHLDALIQALQAELAYYDHHIQLAQSELTQLQNARQAGTHVDDARIRELLEQVPDLRYSRIDVQTRLADAEMKRASLDTLEAQSRTAATIVDQALLPTIPISNHALPRVLLSLLFGLGLGIGLAGLLEYLDTTIKTPEALEKVYSMPVQGIIGMTHKRHLRRQSNYLILLADRSPVAESFRTLRTSLLVANEHAPLRSILVTSTGPGEGKTFIAVNLAASLALSGLRVVLVDTDLRKPSLHHIFSAARSTGFTNLVMNRNSRLEDALQATPIRNLRVLTAGAISSHPTELLTSPQAASLMQQIEEHADIVIYDSPPVATVIDGAIIAGRVDGVLQVVCAGHTQADLVLRCKMVLAQAQAHILGPVLNQVQATDLGQSYYSSYGPYHTYRFITRGPSREGKTVRSKAQAR
jgi:capsular exopolysaccharide synthesis family protein